MDNMLNTKSWNSFYLKNLFQIEKPSARSKNDYEEGSVPFVASGNYNNGIECFLTPKNENDIELIKREKLLEKVRRKKFNNRQSRYKCIWLTDEKCLEYCLKKVVPIERNVPYNIFKVEALGNIFASRNGLFPKKNSSKEKRYEEAIEYWNPNQDELEMVQDKEYLFEGVLKLIKKMK